MPRRMSPSQFRSHVRQLQSQYNQAVNRYNSAVRTHNQKVRTAISQYNQAVDRYNSAARAHNTRVRENRARLQRELTRLANTPAQTRYVTFRTSLDTVQRSYTELVTRADAGGYAEHYEGILDLSEREATRSASVMNALLGNGDDTEPETGLPESELYPLLAQLSADAVDRWRGALFSLNPINPDAARHFCTSARELLTNILDTFAPDRRVLELMPDCERQNSGSPTRRAKIRFFLRQRDMEDAALENFVEDDLENVVQLFRVFNDGTHGSSGRFTHTQLSAIRVRVEGAVMFLWNVIPPTLRASARA